MYPARKNKKEEGRDGRIYNADTTQKDKQIKRIKLSQTARAQRPGLISNVGAWHVYTIGPLNIGSG